MATQKLDFELREFEFPFMSKQTGGAGSFYSDEASAKYRPKLSWVNNLWPLSQGKWAAISEVAQSIDPLPPEAVAAFYSTGVRIYTALVQNQRSYLLIGTSQWWAWSEQQWKLIAEPETAGYPSVFSLKAQTYIVAQGEGVYQFDDSLGVDDLFGAVEEAVLTGVTASDMLSGCAAVSYMILTDGETIYWSSPLNPLHFAPGGTGSDYGAGATKVLGVQSPITFVTGTETGFYIFTESTVVQAVYTKNPDNPWAFDTVENSSGALSLNYIVHQDQLETTFYWSESGLAVLSNGQCEYVASEITELLAGDIYEDYDFSLHRVELLDTHVIYDLQLNFMGNRFLAISYGLTGEPKQKLLVYDSVLRQWFRLTVPHLATTEIVSTSSPGVTYEEAEFTYDEAEMPYSDLLDTITNKQTNTMAIGLIDLSGQLQKLSPIKVSVAAPGENVMPNQLQFDDIRLTKSIFCELHEVVVGFSYPTYPVAGQDNQDIIGPGMVYGQSEEQVSPKPYLVGHRDKLEQRWVQRVQGQKITASLENIGSITSVAFTLRPSGRRMK